MASITSSCKKTKTDPVGISHKLTFF
ncbi:hypothetical protein [Pontibacter anaerobius]